MKMTINSIKCTPFNRMKFSKKLLKGFPDIFVEFFFALIFADFIGIMKLTIVRNYSATFSHGIDYVLN